MGGFEGGDPLLQEDVASPKKDAGGCHGRISPRDALSALRLGGDELLDPPRWALRSQFRCVARARSIGEKIHCHPGRGLEKEGTHWGLPSMGTHGPQPSQI